MSGARSMKPLDPKSGRKKENGRGSSVGLRLVWWLLSQVFCRVSNGAGFSRKREKTGLVTEVLCLSSACVWYFFFGLAFFIGSFFCKLLIFHTFGLTICGLCQGSVLICSEVLEGKS